MIPAILALAILFTTPLAWADDDDLPTHTTNAPAITTLSGNAPVRIASDLQIVSGIKSQKLLPSEYQQEFQASASVVDLQSLLQLREQFFTAQAEYQAAKAGLTAAEQNINRVRDLYQHGVNSERQLQEQQMQLSINSARVASSEFRLQSISDNLSANWGEVLSSWIKMNTNTDIHALIKRQNVLLLLSLPANQSLPANIKQALVDPDANRQHAQIAQLVAPAPQGSHLTQGETYFFTATRGKLRTGMHLSVWINAAGEKIHGHQVANSAVVWHGGQAGIFLKTGSDSFVRQVLKNYYPLVQGYFIADALPNTAEVVTTGAQLLLSQEFRDNIQKEDDGD